MLPVLLLLVLMSGCATQQNHYDPIESANRVTDKVNDGIDRATLKPAARGYTAVVPKPVRTAVSNFFDNTTYMNTVLNDFLQGKGAQGMSDLGRFLVNSSLGIGGLVDVATPMGLERHEEDFGQTLAVWGVGSSAYVVVPLLGPNSLRKAPDFLTATATDPLFWAGFVLAPMITIPVAVIKYVDKRARLLEASDMRDELALDPYVFTREAWQQQREFLIHDGHPPVKQNNADDGWEADDFGSDDGSSGAAPAAPAEPVTRITATASADDVVPAADVEGSHLPSAQPDDQRDGTGKIYIINLSSHYSEVAAAAEQGRLKRLGINTEISVATVRGHTWYRLRSVQRVAAKDARAQLLKLQKKAGISGAWLEKVSVK